MVLETSGSIIVQEGIEMKERFLNNNTYDRKQKIRDRYKGVDRNEIEFIPAIPRKKLFDENDIKRVCAYCRVSTDDPKQTSSYELQKNHYTDMIKEHPGWELAGIFADEGISGTSLAHRENFLRMIEECRKGTIDLVVTKSISRFARNIVDCIAIIRELANLPHPVGVLFETEHLYTLDNTSEMILAVLSATAQEESHTKSEIMNISIEQRFSRGIFLLTELLGFHRDENGNLIINKDEADTVRICFYLFLGGYSAKEIADILTMLGRKRKKGSTSWSANSIHNILRNEKHCGDVLARKTYTPNYLDHKAKKNKQNRNQYRQRDHHEAIIPRKVFLAVQTMLDSHKHMASGPLPILRVVDDGFLCGFVPVNLGWTGFSAEDYLAASESAGNSVAKEMEPSTGPGFQIVRMQMFSTAHSPAVRISKSAIVFTSACMKKFGDAEYVELLLHPSSKRLAVRPCSSSTPGAVHWGRHDNRRWIPMYRAAVAFANVLFQIMKWDTVNVYRSCALCYRENGERLLLFELSEAEILRKNVDSVNRKPARIFPSAWARSFGPAASLERCKKEAEARLYSNGRACNLTAKTVEDLCPLTEKDVDDYLTHAEKIMERVGTQNV